MPRRPREFFAGATYHVTCGTVGGREAFVGGAEVETFLRLLAETKHRDGFAVLAWCLLADRYHLALRCGEVPLWRTMRSLQRRVAREINRRRGESGRLWRSRYAAMRVEGAGQVCALVAWVHARPVALGLVDDAGAYPWSGHRELLGERATGVLDVGEALRFFGLQRASGRRNCQAEMARCLASPWGAGEPGRLPWWRRHGEEAGARERAGTAAAGGQSWAPATFSAETFLEVAARTLEVTLEYLASPRRDRARTRLRELVAVVAVERCGVRGSELARALDRHPVVVSRWIGAARERRSRDEAFRLRYEQLGAALEDRLARYRLRSSLFVSGSDASFVD